MTQALLVVDAQNEFSAGGKRAVPNHSAALAVIRSTWIGRAKNEDRLLGFVTTISQTNHGHSSQDPGEQSSRWTRTRVWSWT